MLPREQTSKIAFLRKIIREYYSQRPLEEPGDLHKREIALESLEDAAYIRHLAFPYMSALYEYITTVKTPLHLYHSSALYAVPDADIMENKIWEGSELLFDIDADKYEGCNKRIWICPESGEAYDTVLGACPQGEKPVEYLSLPWMCIVKAWNSALRLVDVLEKDFGYSKIKIYFSGNRGFHVKVLDQEVLQLGREARRAIADYVSCNELDLDTLFPAYRGKAVFRTPEYGLRKRVLELAMKRGIIERRRVKELEDVMLVDLEYVKAILREVCVDVDRAVTMDTTRLSRFGNSLNMKAGFKVTELKRDIDVDRLRYECFSPFKGTLKVKSLVTGGVDVLDTKLNLVRGNIYRVEAYIGVYMVVKGLALPVDFNELEVRP
ncbi:MAG: DNA primase small subunit domain-containing protein [Desulfurococcaceae archaeon]